MKRKRKKRKTSLNSVVERKINLRSKNIHYRIPGKTKTMRAQAMTMIAANPAALRLNRSNRRKPTITGAKLAN